MILLTSPKHDTWAALTALTAGVLTWQSTALMMAGSLTAWTVMRLLAERQTLLALTRTAPEGLITIRRNPSREPTFHLVWGADPDQRGRQSET
ncbi:hypothetical protein [Herbidospora mongoliensis]|uniref:hypothetical protein n=1 Tax=Herbidospora mongoliensis TaxID=688067 RepID=UPI00083296BF|nr:hypothetical protein [Herbidospora mongoliensis]